MSSISSGKKVLKLSFQRSLKIQEVDVDKILQQNTHLLRKGKYHLTPDLFEYSCFAYA